MSKNITPQLTRGLRADILLCDSDGTPNASGTPRQQSTVLYAVTQADKTLTNQWYDHGDEDNLVKNTLAVADLLDTIDNNQQFIADPWLQLMYEEEATGDCSVKIKLFTKLYEYAIDSDGDKAIDSDEDTAIAPKEGVTIL